MTFRYCPPNETINDYWIDHGMNICFLETVTSASIVGFISIFGTIQLLLYWRFGTRLLDVNIPSNRLFRLQVASHIILSIIAVVDVTLRHLLFRHDFYGYELLYVLSACVAWPMCIIVLLVERNFQLPSPPSHGHGVVLLITWSLGFISENLAFLSIDNEQWWFHLSGLENKVEFGFWCLRYAFTFVVFILGIKAPGISTVRDYYSRYSDTEHLVRNEEGQGETITENRPATHWEAWKKFARNMRILMPYMWPKNSCILQLRVIICVILLIGVRVINVYVPLLTKDIINKLAGNGGKEVSFCWQLILVYVALKWLQGGGTGSGGLLNIIRSQLWIKIQQYTTREIQVGLFSHLHKLSLRWHLSRKTGEVLRIIDRGTSSINSLLSYLIFNIVPTIIDIVVAIGFFCALFDLWFGLIVFITMAVYLGSTIFVTEWRKKFRRIMNEKQNKYKQKAVDSLLNFETVKYYGAEQEEVSQYNTSIEQYQEEEWKTMSSMYLLNFVQGDIMNIGLAIGLLYCAYLISISNKTVGDYALFAAYLAQVMVPLNWLGTLYRVIQDAFVDMENMLELMDEPVEVKDVPNALPLMAMKGKIDFRNVSFYYSEDRPILKDINFTINPGQTYAIVGPTGSGKTTIMRLLFRFYDVQKGHIFIDNQNIAEVTQRSLRKAIGVVPQDTVLFNDTISSNIRYARMDATDQEVEEAAAHADIHDKILTFTEGYNSVVGERGLKLSGGEKQRVAIARTLLKTPVLVLLDEATSALDSKTEKNIQESLSKVCAGKTTLIVAHRLSTITHADCILVIQDGEIAERGRHEELLDSEGIYADMWNQQSKQQTKSDNADEGENDKDSKPSKGKGVGKNGNSNIT